MQGVFRECARERDNKGKPAPRREEMLPNCVQESERGRGL